MGGNLRQTLGLFGDPSDVARDKTTPAHHTGLARSPDRHSQQICMLATGVSEGRCEGFWVHV
jgi:hypothetical protein